MREIQLQIMFTKPSFTWNAPTDLCGEYSSLKLWRISEIVKYKFIFRLCGPNRWVYIFIPFRCIAVSGKIRVWNTDRAMISILITTRRKFHKICKNYIKFHALPYLFYFIFLTKFLKNLYFCQTTNCRKDSSSICGPLTLWRPLKFRWM